MACSHHLAQNYFLTNSYIIHHQNAFHESPLSSQMVCVHSHIYYLNRLTFSLGLFSLAVQASLFAACFCTSDKVKHQTCCASNLYSENSIGEDTLANVACASCGCIQCVRIHIREYQKTLQLVHISTLGPIGVCFTPIHALQNSMHVASYAMIYCTVS